MAGVKGSWNKVIKNIEELSKMTYVTAGMVFTEQNIERCIESVMFAKSLGVSDVRVIPSAQYNMALAKLSKLPDEILNQYPILKYRINNVKNDRHVRGIVDEDCDKCYIVLDDMAVAQDKHFPCIIYMREKGNPIGTVGPNMRAERYEWFKKHNSKQDEICRVNCLECLCHHNNTVEVLRTVGRKITKRSGKPFKSGNKIGTIKDVKINPHSNKPGFLLEDGSVVNQDVCLFME